VILKPVTAQPGIGFDVRYDGISRPNGNPASDLRDVYGVYNTTLASGNFTLGAGDDQFTLQDSDSQGLIRIDGGAGNDYFFINRVPSPIQAILGGSGKDDMTIRAAGATGTVNGGEGDDELRVFAGSNVQLIEAGSGSDLVVISDSTIIRKIDLGDGNDNGQYERESRVDEIIAGNGSDVVFIPALGVSECIIDLAEGVQSSDKIFANRFLPSDLFGGGNISAVTIKGFSVEYDAILLPTEAELTYKWSYNGVDSFLTATSPIDGSETAPFLIVTNADLEQGLSPFTVKANGLDFKKWDRSADIYMASGTIILGDKRSGDLFKVQGSAKVDLKSKTIQLSGIFTTLTGSAEIKNQVLLGASGLTINVATRTGFFEGDPIVDLGGIEIGVNDLVFLDEGYRFGFDIDTLPEDLGIDSSINVGVSAGFLVTQDTIELSDASLNLPGPYKLFGALDVNAKDISISYDWPSDALLLRGILESKNLFGPLGPKNVTLDLATDKNLIQIKDGTADLIGFISVEGFKFEGVPWEIDKILLGIDTIGKKVNGQLVVKFPFKATIPPGGDISAGVSLDFLYNPTTQLNAIKLEASTNGITYIPIPAFPAAGVTGIAGSVNNIATVEIAFAGDLDLVFGPARLIKAKFSGKVTENQLKGAIAMTFSNKVLASYDANATLDWSKGLFNAEGVLNLLDGLVTVNQEIKTN